MEEVAVTAYTPWSGLFGAVERWFADERNGPWQPLDGGDGPLTPGEARAVLYDRSANAAVRAELWRQVAARARADADGNGWRLVAVWLALPGLRGTVFKVSRRFRADRQDLASELVTGFLTALAEVGPATADPGDVLLRAVCGQAWDLARRTLRERPVEDVDVAARYAPDDTWQAEFEAPWHPGDRKLTASVRITVPAERAEGIRIGALAQEWGLAGTATEARLLRRGRRVGALSLRGGGRRG
ncbi:hypothetical protein [Streptomyces sp. NPDC002067]